MNLQTPSSHKNLPSSPGVYLMKNAGGDVLYVGKASSLRQRVASYFQPSAHPYSMVKPMMRYVENVDYVVTANSVDALILENNLIKEHQPRYNVKLKDDKRYPYLKVSVQEPFPRLSVTRQTDNSGARFFGPYVHVRAIRQTIKQLTKIFPIRTCGLDLEATGNPYRACLDYHINRCPGALCRPD